MFFLLKLASLFLLCFPPCSRSFPVTGATGGINRATGERPSRQEFSVFASSGAAFDLFILAFQRLQQENQSSPLSYYQIAGIHGHPFRSWDGVWGDQPAGYCAHQSILFPSWHRPYVALFEQVLWSHAQQVAFTYPPSSRAQYEAAAQSLRVPYWDWSVNATVPTLVNERRISVNTPTGLRSIRNPLLTYRFHPQPSEFDFPLDSSPVAKYRHTVRFPDSKGQSQPDLANRQLQANARALRELTYHLILDQSDYAPFSNYAYTDRRGGRYNSIENIHNGIHTLIGNGGHMSVIPYSSFDPIFWLHHANIDRLIAIWQSIHPDSYVTSQRNNEATFTSSLGAIADRNTPLTPFHPPFELKKFYTSATARHTRTFGYTYPEINDWEVHSPVQLSLIVRANFRKLYPTMNGMAARKTSSFRQRRYPISRRVADTLTRSSSVEHHEYFINIRVAQNALPQSYYIHFFFKEPEVDDKAEFGWAPNLIGSFSVLRHSRSSSSVDSDAPAVAGDSEILSNRTGNTDIDNQLRHSNSLPVRDAQVSLRYGQIPLTQSLRGLSSDDISGSLNLSHVIPYLKASLRFRLQYLDGSHPLPKIQGDECAELKKSLRMFVIGRTVDDDGNEDSTPRYGEMEAFREVTEAWPIGALGRREEM